METKTNKNYSMEVGESHEDEFNVFATSLVENPATEAEWLFFNKQVEDSESEVKLEQHDEYERILSGVWLKPDFDYIRVDKETNSTYKISITKDNLLQAVKNFAKGSNKDNFDIEHNGKMINDKFSMIELWVLYDHNILSPVLLNSISDLGYSKEDVPLGTVFMSVYVNDEQFFKDEIVTGKVKGFSIEGMFKMIELDNTIELNKDNKEDKEDMTIKELYDQLKSLFTSTKLESEVVNTEDTTIATENTDDSVTEVAEVISEDDTTNETTNETTKDEVTDVEEDKGDESPTDNEVNEDEVIDNKETEQVKTYEVEYNEYVSKYNELSDEYKELTAKYDEVNSKYKTLNSKISKVSNVSSDKNYNPAIGYNKNINKTRRTVTINKVTYFV